MRNGYRNIGPRQLVFLVLISLCASSPLHADMGAIHLSSSDATVSEPAQKAIILHNGSEEILILETDLKASAKTDILRFIPFPAEPKVSLAPENAIQEMGRLVQAKKLQYIMVAHTKGGSSAHNQPVAEVVSSAKLGAHDVTVVKINDAAHFSRWVREQFKSRKQLQSGPELEQVARVAAEYVKDGIYYFVFDFVTIDDTDKSVAPVAFQFKSRKMYYPLRTSNTIGGKGQVQLFFLAMDCVRQPFNNEILSHMNGSEREFSNFLFSSIAEVKPEEANAIYPGAAAFFDGRPIVLQAASYSGTLKFERDMYAFMLTHYDPKLYQPGGAVQSSAVDPGDFFSGLNAGRFRGEDPFFHADRLEKQRHLMLASLTGGSFQLTSAGKKVQFRDGRYKDSAIQVEIDRAAFGDLNGDSVPDAAVITETVKKGGKACELTMFTGKSAIPFGDPTLERTASVLLKSCDARDFSITDNTIRITGKSGGVESYRLLNGKLAPIE